MTALTDAPLVEWVDRAQWRAWLEANHGTVRGAWLVTRRDARAAVYGAAVEEALCFGWVDSTGGYLDEERSKLYFTQRKPTSGWAATNKVRVERLVAQGLMAPAGLAAIERAKANGSWTVLDGPERLEVPPDLAAELGAHPAAATNFAAWPASIRKQALASIAQAKRAETRSARIAKIVDGASRNVRPG